MTNQNALALAKEIAKDLNSAYQYYMDPKVLTELLRGKFGSLESTDTAAEVANAILADRKGANYYSDPELLATYLESNGIR